MRRTSTQTWADEALFSIRITLDLFGVDPPHYTVTLPEAVRAAKYLRHGSPSIRALFLRRYPRLILPFVRVWLAWRLFGVDGGIVRQPRW